MPSTHDRDAADSNDSSKSVNMATLLNALDGVATPHGLITIMTTNHFDKLDPALTRPGRMDVVEEIQPPDAEQIARLYEMYYGVPLEDTLGLDNSVSRFSHAEIGECFKRNLDSPEAGLKELLEKFQEGVVHSA